LAAFVAELARLRELCGSPSLTELASHSAVLQHPLARSTISDKLTAKSFPDWDFVVSFVMACDAHARKAGALAPPDDVDLARWDARHLQLLRELDLGRRDERLHLAAQTALRQRDVAIERPVPRQLPAAVRQFAGRIEQLGLLTGLADEAAGGATVVISVIHGTAGVGKTTLAVRAAHLVADRFPDGQLYVNLRGFDPDGQVVNPADAIIGFLEALSVPPEQLPASRAAQVNLYRSLLSERRVLVLLDNARDAEQVRPLIPGTPGSMVLVTSRDRLTSLVARDGAQPLLLDLPTDAEARQLLASRLGRDRILSDAGAISEIIERCARLPLALSVVAARASTNPSNSLATLVDELRAAPGALDVLDTEDPATGVRPAFSWSYRRLTEDAARLFRLLSIHPGPDAAPATVACLTGMAEPRAREALRELADVHLVDEYRPARYRFHDLLRAYSGELSVELDSPTERRAAARRILADNGCG
jgi:hypothetical protein